MVIVLLAKVVNVPPLKSSATVDLKSSRVAIAIFSPRRSDSAWSERQCTPEMLRPIPMLLASLSNSSPTVRVSLSAPV